MLYAPCPMPYAVGKKEIELFALYRIRLSFAALTDSALYFIKN